MDIDILFEEDLPKYEKIFCRMINSEEMIVEMFLPNCEIIKKFKEKFRNKVQKYKQDDEFYIYYKVK